VEILVRDARELPLSTTGSRPSPRLRVIVVGGGIAGAEAVLALHALAGDRVETTLVSTGPDLVYRPLAVAQPFGLGQPHRYPLTELTEVAGARLVQGTLAAVDAPRRSIRLASGESLDYDALVVTVGAHAVAAIEHATTWWPEGDPDAYGGLLRDLEEGYSRRVVFAVPVGAVWPLPIYELALMTARDVSGMGIDGAELTVVTPEAVPLGLFGAAAADAVAEELRTAGVGLETASLARVVRQPALEVVLEPSGRRLPTDRVLAVPEVVGPRLPGLPHDADGFLPVDAHGRVRDTEGVWAAGDGIAYPVKYGGLATQQADAVAADVASLAGAAVAPEPARPRLTGVLMTGTRPRALGDAAGDAGDRPGPIWRPEGKVSGTYLTPYLAERYGAVADPGPKPSEGVLVEEVLPHADAGPEPAFSALRPAGSGSDQRLRGLGRRMHDYDAHLRQSDDLLRRGARPRSTDG